MAAVVMTADELREYIRELPEHILLRITVQEEEDATEEV